MQGSHFYFLCVVTCFELTIFILKLLILVPFAELEHVITHKGKGMTYIWQYKVLWPSTQRRIYCCFCWVLLLYSFSVLRIGLSRCLSHTVGGVFTNYHNSLSLRILSLLLPVFFCFTTTAKILAGILPAMKSLSRFGNVPWKYNEILIKTCRYCFCCLGNSW